MSFVFMVTKNDMMMTKAKEERKIEFIYAFEMFCFLGQRMFYIETVFNWMLLQYKDWIKENIHLSMV